MVHPAPPARALAARRLADFSRGYATRSSPAALACPLRRLGAAGISAAGPAHAAASPGEDDMEFLWVNFDEPRLVLVNGNPGGHTNKVITIPQPGTYRIRLDGRLDFAPDVHEVTLFHSNSFEPIELSFHRLPPSAIHP